MSVTIPEFKDKNWMEIAAMTPIQFQAYTDQLQAAASRILYDRDLETAAELKAAGWTPEPVTPSSCVYQWKWRRPGKNGKRGRLFQSPTQALNALRKSPRP